MRDRATERPPLKTVAGEPALWILLATVVLFFARPLFFGETFFFRDLTLFSLPQRLRLVELVRTCGLPLWDPYLHGGQPFLANPSNLALYPTGVLYFVLPALTAFNIEIVLHFALCALACYWLSRILGLDATCSLIAGAAFTFSGFTLSTANLLNRLLAMPNTVFLLLFWHLYLLERRPRWLAGTVVSGALLVFAGSVEFLILTFLIALGWALFFPYPPTSPRIKSRPLIWVAVVVTVLGIASVLILPGLEIIRQSTRGSGLDFQAVSRWSLNPRRLPELVLPGFLGPTHTLAESDFWGARLEDDGYPLVLSIYFGLSVLALASTEAAAPADDCFPRRFRRFLLVVAMTAPILALGRFALLTPPVYRALPFADVFRYPIKALSAAVLPAALLAGGGAGRLVRRTSVDGNRWRSPSLVFWTAAAMLAALGAMLARGGSLASAFERFFFLTDVSRLPNVGLPFLHSASVAVGLAVILAPHRPNRPWRSTALACLVIADLAVAGRSVNPYLRRSLFRVEPAIVSAVRPQLAGGRLFRDRTPNVYTVVASSNDISWNFLWRRETLDFYTASAFGIPVIFHDDYDGLAQKRLIRLTSMISKLPWDRRLPLVSAGNVTAIISAEQLSLPGLQRLGQFRGHGNVAFSLYRNSTAAPRIGFVSTSVFVESETDALKAVVSRGFDPRRHVVLEGRAAPIQGGACAARISELERSPASWTARVSAPCDGYLVFSEPFYPGWKASVDGDARPTLRANVAFSAIAISAGTHVVRRSYRPPSLVLGAALSVLFAILAIVLGQVFQERKPPGPLETRQ